jgi:hypothetical protein
MLQARTDLSAPTLFYACCNRSELSYGIDASNGILFNHEAPTCGGTLVTCKIARAVAVIELGSRASPFSAPSMTGVAHTVACFVRGRDQACRK